MNASVCPFYYRFDFVIVFIISILIFNSASAQNKNEQLLKTFKNIKSKDSAESYAKQLIGIAQKKHDQLFEAQVLYAQSLKVFKSGDELRALDLAYQSNKLASVKDPATYTSSATMIAYMLGSRGKYVDALKQAFDILRKTDNYGWKKEGINCRICISDLYRQMGDPQKALPYAFQASKDAKSLKDTGLFMFSTATLSNLYSAKEIRSKENLNRAAVYLETLLSPPYLAKIANYNKAQYLGNLGRIYEMQDKFELAERMQQQAIDIAEANKFIALKKHSLNELTTCEIDLKNYKKAITYSMQALAMQNEKQTNLIETRNIYHQLSRCYEGLGDYKNALDYTKRSQLITDSLNDANKDKAATELDEKYKADKRLLLADSREQKATLQRNFIIVIAILILLAIIAGYRWLAYKNKREADLLNERHLQLARLNDMKSRFFANISHELRTPLTLIMGPAEQLLNDPELNPQQQGYLQSVFRNSKKLLGMVNELLDLGRIEAGTLSLKLTSIDLGWFVNVIYQSFASAAAYKNISYTISTTITTPVFVKLDADKFEKIVNNLLSNAIKFTPAGQSVNVWLAATDGTIKLTVTDDGKGIHPDDLPFIFDRYFQSNQDSANAEGGTGIGLAIAREFSELMAGTITVKSTLGVGSVFTFTMPLVLADSVVDLGQHELPQHITKTAKENSNTGELVLIVEDHLEMAQYVSTIIDPFYRVAIAQNGKDALELLRAMPALPKLVISDAMMPEMNGFELLDILKHDEALCAIPVIMLTALGDHQNRLKALHIGVDDYLTKPFISSELLARVNNLIRNASDRKVLSLEETQEYAQLTDLEVTEPVNELFKIPEPVASPADLLWLSELEALVRKFAGKADLNIAVLSYDLAISERQLFRRVKAVTGLTPNMYIRTIRLQIAREAIESGKYRTISEVAYAAGFETPAYFSKLFKDHYGRDISELL